MSDHAVPNGVPLDEFRGFLCYLARMHLDPRLRRKLDPEDIVQETFLKAHRAWDSCNNKTPPGIKAWLRPILIRTLWREVEKIRKELNLEVSIQDAARDSSERLHDFLAAEQTTPGTHAVRNEEALHLEEAMQELRAEQREVVRLKKLLGWPTAQVSEHLGISRSAVAGLLHRGITELADRLSEQE